MRCSMCDTEMPAYAKYCAICGAPLDETIAIVYESSVQESSSTPSESSEQARQDSQTEGSAKVKSRRLSIHIE